MDILSDVNINGTIFLGDKNVYIENSNSRTMYLGADRVNTNIFCANFFECPEVGVRALSLNGSYTTPRLEFDSSCIAIVDGNHACGFSKFILSCLAKRSPYGTVMTLSVPAQCSKFLLSQSEFDYPLVQAYRLDGKQVEMDYTYDGNTGSLTAELTPFSETTDVRFRII